jgi:BMFP domain-containing protein YqiC
MPYTDLAAERDALRARIAELEAQVPSEEGDHA